MFRGHTIQSLRFAINLLPIPAPDPRATSNKLMHMGTQILLRRRVAAVGAMILAATALAQAETQPALATAESMFQESETPTPCPAVVVLAARGSSETRWLDETLPPEPWTFTQPDRQGWEGKALHFMYRHIDSYARSTYDIDPFAQVSFLPLDEGYPAVPVLGSDAGYGSIPFDRMHKSSQLGSDNALHTIDDYEAASACHPKYLLTGYSQGALALQPIEVELEQRGQFAGVIYLGSPVKVHADPRSHFIGTDLRDGVMVLDPDLLAPAAQIAQAHRTEYCIETDFVCNFDQHNSENFVLGFGGDHKDYFKGPASTQEQRDAVAEDFLEYVAAATGG